MNRRALAIAAIVAALGVILLVLYQRRFELDASGGERVTVLVAAKKIDRGVILTDDMIGTRKVPIAWVEDRAIKESERSKILGLPAANTVLAQQTVMWTDMVNAQDEQVNLSDRVEPGYRAVTIHVDRSDSAVTLIRPGDYVDVFGTFIKGADDKGERFSKLLLEKVLVLATGNDTSRDRDETKKVREDILTLSLGPQEVNIMSLASESGRLTVAVRSVRDQTRIKSAEMGQNQFEGITGQRSVARPTSTVPQLITAPR